MNKEDLELLAYGLLGGRGNLGQNLAQAGLLMQQGRRDREDRAQQKQQQEVANQLRQMQLQQAQQQQDVRSRLGQAASEAFQAPQPLGATPFDDQGQPMMTPGGGGMSAFAQKAMQIDPLGMGMQLQSQMQKTQAPVKLGAGDVLFDPNTGKQIYRAPEKTPDWQNPEYQAFQLRKAREGAARVNVDNKQESEFSKAVGKELGAQYTDLMKGDAMAASKINRFKRLESLLPQAGTTGRFAPIAKDLASAAQSLGINVDASKLGTQEAVEALSNEMALQLRNPSGGAGMPGAMSDQDRAFLQNMTPGLGKTQEGNRLMIQTAVKLAERDRQVAKLARDYRKKNGRFDEGFFEELAQWSNANPLFEQVIRAPAAAAPQMNPQGGFSIRRLPNG